MSDDNKNIYDNEKTTNDTTSIDINTNDPDNKNKVNPIKVLFGFLGGFTALIIALIILFGSIFIVDEAHQAVITRFGKVTKVVVNEKTPELVTEIQNTLKRKDIKIVEGKGIFFKTPFLDHVELFDSRLLTYDTSPREVTTKDKKKLILDNNAQWRIHNPLRFKMTVKNERNAHTKLDDILYSKLNEKIGQTDAHILIANKNYTNELLKQVAIEVNTEVSDFGITVADIRIKRTDLPIENSTNIFNRMRTEREQKAKQYRSEGKEEAQKIRSNADKEAIILEAQAYAEAEKIKGEGDAEAIKIYNEAFNADPEFYEFYRTLQSYKKTLDNKTKIVIDPSSPFLKYLMGENKGQQ